MSAPVDSRDQTAMNQHIKHGLDAAAAGGAFASFAGYLPTLLACIASMLSIIWLTIQITEWYLKRQTRR